MAPWAPHAQGNELLSLATITFLRIFQLHAPAEFLKDSPPLMKINDLHGQTVCLLPHYNSLLI